MNATDPTQGIPSSAIADAAKRAQSASSGNVSGGQGLNRSLSAKSPQQKFDAKLHKVAKQFEATFMTEMLRLVRPEDKAAKGFSTGESGGTWQVFMDQALGDAASANGGSGLAKQIEDSLRKTHSTLKGSHG